MYLKETNKIHNKARLNALISLEKHGLIRNDILRLYVADLIEKELTDKFNSYMHNNSESNLRNLVF